ATPFRPSRGPNGSAPPLRPLCIPRRRCGDPPHRRQNLAVVVPLCKSAQSLFDFDRCPFRPLLHRRVNRDGFRSNWFDCKPLTHRNPRPPRKQIFRSIRPLFASLFAFSSLSLSPRSRGGNLHFRVLFT